VNSKLDKVYKESVLVYLGTLTQYLRTQTMQSHGNPVIIAGLQSKIRTQDLPNTKQGFYPLDNRVRSSSTHLTTEFGPVLHTRQQSSVQFYLLDNRVRSSSTYSTTEFGPILPTRQQSSVQFYLLDNRVRSGLFYSYTRTNRRDVFITHI
jgi:hypothetical protein